ncbi:energy transducer TonB [Marinobacter sp. F4216]|uniref:energy transducer TonB family protein n=1 Tax=Marinobacter sp. F4216 TaxID=2874281 RepID=UPI001CBE50FF|nr:energy transducer TonB [Marinobacter sp. F4216]MBZ2167282.1 energy transducer TonB [Marinobacter sp. F4216]
MSIPGVSQLSEKLSLEVELQLLGNGALTRAKILKSSGIKRLDDAAYHASLSASPYPAPPAHHDDQNRFEVELIFSPKRF